MFSDQWLSFIWPMLAFFFAVLTIASFFVAIKNRRISQRFSKNLGVCHERLQKEMRRRKQIEEELKASRVSLAHYSRLIALGEMAAGLAYEITNPLTILMGEIDKLRHPPSSDAHPRDQELAALNSIERNVMRAAKIVRGLRMFSSEISTESSSLANISGIFEDALTLCQQKLRSCEIQISVDKIPQNLCIECRPVQISQVILNLIGNAYDAIRSLPEKWIRLSAAEHNGQIIISIMHSGKTPPEIIPKLFQPVFASKEMEKETCLGLNISKEIIEQHGGNLFLDEQCSNTRFLITLPKPRTNHNVAA